MGMKTPSIESILVRKPQEKSYPIAKRLYDRPYIGALARAWVRATHPASMQARWAVLPPVAAA